MVMVALSGEMVVRGGTSDVKLRYAIKVSVSSYIPSFMRGMGTRTKALEESNISTKGPTFIKSPPRPSTRKIKFHSGQ